MTDTSVCKICGAPAKVAFRIPSTKLAGHPIPDSPDDCAYYQCTKCEFCFSHILDAVDNTAVYDEQYWNNQDPDWYGRTNETQRLILLANQIIQKNPWDLEILDYGCGMGAWLKIARETLHLKVWGTDINRPKFGTDFYLNQIPAGKFDIVTACEVIEHLPDPKAMIGAAIKALKPGGVFAFQTANYDPHSDGGREWWYVGPANGHVSLYSRKSLDALFAHFHGTRRILWDNYAGLQVWQIGK